MLTQRASLERLVTKKIRPYLRWVLEVRSVSFNKHLGQPDVLLTVVQEIGIVLTVRCNL